MRTNRFQCHTQERWWFSPLLSLLFCCGHNQLVHTASHQLKLHWWAHPPYTYTLKNESAFEEAVMHGVIPSILRGIIPLCNITESMTNQSQYVVSMEFYDTHLDFHQESQHILRPVGDLTSDLYLPVAIRADDDANPFVHPNETDPSNLLFIPILTSPGAVHFYKMNSEPVASDLLNVILQGWPMLILIMLGAGYSGIIIWLLDRLWNESHFPKPFLKGFWEGFWWAFVTMTTVGYGDTTPRSIQARIFGLVWIVVGVTILSVFTATVTTVLTQETLGVHHRLQGQRIGIIKGSEEFALIVREGGYPVAAEGFDDLVRLLSQGNVSGAVYDQYAFSSNQHKLDDQFLVHKLIENKVQHGVLVHTTDTGLRECLQTQARNFRWLAFRELAGVIKALSTKTSSLAESAQTLFQPKTITYMWYGSLVWLVIFCGFIIWEFAYWRPKHRRRQAIKTAVLKSRLGHPSGDPSLSGSPNVITMDIRDSYTQQTQETKLSNKSGKTLRNKVKNGILGRRIPVTTFYANHGFDKSNERNSSSQIEIQGAETVKTVKERAFRSDSLREVTSLEALVKRQKDELEEIEQELVRYKYHWEGRVNDLRRLHREERRKMLRLIDHDDLFRNATRNTSPVNINDGGKLNNEEPADQGDFSAFPGTGPLNVYDL